MEAHDKPRMVVLAGPNGSGKSTVTNGLRESEFFPKHYINADDIAKSLESSISDVNMRNLKAANLAEQGRKEAVTGDKPFAFETVMSTPAKMGLFDEARRNGFQVDMVFVTTESPLINVARVEDRVAKGGHDVPAEKIVERYGRAMDLLPAALQKADNAQVYDNSYHGVKPMLVAQKIDGVLSFPDLVKPDNMLQKDFERMQQWAREKIREPLEQHEKSRDGLAAMIKGVDGATVAHADVTNGTSYTGRVIGVTEQHVLQHIDGGKQFVLHDRALASPALAAIKGPTEESITTAYNFGPDGKHAKPTQPTVDQSNNIGMDPSGKIPSKL
jgi:predicted ABC-type ATPase